MLGDTDSLIFISAIVGIIFILWALRRRFRRTNIFGAERFPSFGDKLMATFFDALLRGIGIICLLTSALTWIFEYAAAWGWVAVFFYLALAFEKDYYRYK